MPDGGALTVYRGYIQSAMAEATYLTLFGSYNTTDVGPVSELSSPKTSGSVETDIIYKYRDLGPGTYGRAECDDNSIGGNRCDQFYVYFNYVFSNANDQQSWYTTFTRALACHETGHAVGLTHGAEAYPSISNQNSSLHCMRT